MEEVVDATLWENYLKDQPLGVCELSKLFYLNQNNIGKKIEIRAVQTI